MNFEELQVSPSAVMRRMTPSRGPKLGSLIRGKKVKVVMDLATGLSSSSSSSASFAALARCSCAKQKVKINAYKLYTLNQGELYSVVDAILFFPTYISNKVAFSFQIGDVALPI